MTLNTLVQAAWSVLLSRYSGQTCVRRSARRLQGRPAELRGVEQLVGLFINTFPLIAEVRAEAAVGAWLQELQAQNVASREHEHTALHEIQRWAGTSREGLFDTLLVFENYPVDETLRRSATQRPAFLRRALSGSHALSADDSRGPRYEPGAALWSSRGVLHRGADRHGLPPR